MAELIIDSLNHEHYVAHYTNRTGFKKILKHHRIRMGKAKNVNDITENAMDWFEGDAATGKPDAASLSGYETQEKEIISLLKNRTRIFCATRCKHPSPRDLNESLENHYFAKPSLWASYGDKHKGVCLILDEKELTNAMETTFPGFHKSDKIEYHPSYGLDYSGEAFKRDEYAHYLKEYDILWAAVKDSDFYHRKFFHKTPCWETEDEFRWMVFSKDSAPSYIDIGSALKAVLLGGKIDLINKKHDLKILEWIIEHKKTHKQDYPIYQITAQHHKYCIEEVDKLDNYLKWPDAGK